MGYCSAFHRRPQEFQQCGQSTLQCCKAACLIKAPHAEASLAGADVRAHEGRLQSSRPGCVLRGRLELAQHERRGGAVGWVGRHVRRQVSRRPVGSQRALQWRAAN